MAKSTHRIHWTTGILASLPLEECQRSVTYSFRSQSHFAANDFAAVGSHEKHPTEEPVRAALEGGADMSSTTTCHTYRP